MTIVTFAVFEPAAGSEDIPARGYLRFTPTKSPSAGVTEVLPLPFTVRLVDGMASADLRPTTLGWSWAVTYQLLGLIHETRHYLVPDTDTIPHTSLAEVNPLDLIPVPAQQPDPEWYAYVDQLAEGQIGVVPVITGNEERIPFGSVFWVGGTTQPVNMAENTDIWFRAAS